MFSLNRVTLIGNLTRDPELRYTPSGQAVASYSIATNRRWTTKEGETQDATEFHEIVAWGKLGEISQQLLSKGKKAYVEGRMQTRSWEAPDGAKRQRTEIIAENIIALSPRGEGDTTSHSEAPVRPAAKPAASKKADTTSNSQPATPPSGDEEIDLSDLPF
jgi:single-strand DNA-binding protein